MISKSIRLLPLRQHAVRTLSQSAVRHPVPPFTKETAMQKVQAAEDAWNRRDAVKVSQAYTVDSVWRNRGEFIQGRDAIQQFLEKKWKSEQDYVLKKHYFTHTENKIAVTFQYEYRKVGEDQWYRAYGNEHWTFDDAGYMAVRNASINDVPIDASERILAVDPKDRNEDEIAALSDGTKR